MEDSEIKTEISEPMESQSNNADKIDMSLDEIIKLNKREQRATRAASRARNKRSTTRNNVLKKLSQIPQTRRGLRRGTLQYQGPSRSRGLSRARGPGRRGTPRGSGQSPLTRASADASTEHSLGPPAVSFRGGFHGRGRGRGRGRGGLSRSALSVRGQRGSGVRPFLLDRGYAALRGAGQLERYQKIRSQSMPSSPGTTLRVSLANATLESATQVRPKRGGAVLRGRSSEGVGSLTPKGIPLHFNYRATTNHTGVSLNDRFTSLRIRGRGLKAERGRGRGLGRGRGRGQGRGEIMGGVRGGAKGGLAMTRGGRGRGGRGRGGRGRGGRAATRAGRTVILQ